MVIQRMVFVSKQTDTQRFHNKVAQPHFTKINIKICDQNETFLVIFKYCVAQS